MWSPMFSREGARMLRTGKGAMLTCSDRRCETEERKQVYGRVGWEWWKSEGRGAGWLMRDVKKEKMKKTKTNLFVRSERGGPTKRVRTRDKEQWIWRGRDKDEEGGGELCVSSVSLGGNSSLRCWHCSNKSFFTVHSGLDLFKATEQTHLSPETLWL